MTVQIPEELARLHQLVSWYDLPRWLPEAARAGKACVWCAGRADATAVELEPSAALPRRACTRCYAARLAWYITWYDWHGHFSACTPCRQHQTCYVGHGRRLQHERTMPPIDKKPVCLSCPAPLLATELVAPVRWEGSDGFNLGYVHLRCLSRRAIVT
ncbi:MULTISPECIES: hypothetical protein [Streptomyces]|uniref:hypothetical protein n=1 Tax=Streptomyces TaxID=1883 RepID=UPI0019B55FD6|nr:MULTISPECIES: hypothetical protein [Streptomyces]GGR71291.1 hypothetical protein GCM10010236_27030 [Streptomyces eurythermus]